MRTAVPAQITVEAADRLGVLAGVGTCEACGDRVDATHAWRVAYTDRHSGGSSVVHVCPECAFALTSVSSLG